MRICIRSNEISLSRYENRYIHIYIYITSILSGIVETFLVKTLNSFDRLIYLIYLYYISKVSPFYSLVSRVSFSWNIISLPERNNETIILFVIIETFSIRTFFIRPFYFLSVILKSKNYLFPFFFLRFSSIDSIDRHWREKEKRKKEKNRDTFSRFPYRVGDK